MGDSRSRRRLLLALAPAACAACTLTGLGDYPIASCPDTVGTAVGKPQSVGQFPAVSISNADGKSPAGAFVLTSTTQGTCVQGVGVAGGQVGYLAPGSCVVPDKSGLAPEQPWIVSTPGGYAVAAVATTAPCKQGRLSFWSYASGSATNPSQAACDTAGAALPAVGPDGTDALVAWYETAWDSRRSRGCRRRAPGS